MDAGAFTRLLHYCYYGHFVPHTSLNHAGFFRARSARRTHSNAPQLRAIDPDRRFFIPLQLPAPINWKDFNAARCLREIRKFSH